MRAGGRTSELVGFSAFAGRNRLERGRHRPQPRRQLLLAVMPAVGAAIGAGRGELAMLLLAAIKLAAALANLRPAASGSAT